MSSLAEGVSAAYSRPPRRVHVAGASRYFRPECNGVFSLVRMHNDRPLYQASSGAIVYFDRQWKLNHESGTTGWSFISRGAPWLVPPQGRWAAVDQASGEPVLAHVPSHDPQGRLQTLRPDIDSSPIAVKGLPPQRVVVTGCDVPECNGAYAFAKTHNFRPLYRAPSGAILYFHTFWRINVDGHILGWAFFARGGVVPPEDGWVSVDPDGTAPRVETVLLGTSHAASCPPSSPSKTPRRPWRKADVFGSSAPRSSDYEYHKKHGSGMLYTAPLRRRLVEEWLSESRELEMGL